MLIDMYDIIVFGRVFIMQKGGVNKGFSKISVLLIGIRVHAKYSNHVCIFAYLLMSSGRNYLEDSSGTKINCLYNINMT